MSLTNRKALIINDSATAWSTQFISLLLWLNGWIFATEESLELGLRCVSRIGGMEDVMHLIPPQISSDSPFRSFRAIGRSQELPDPFNRPLSLKGHGNHRARRHKFFDLGEEGKVG